MTHTTTLINDHLGSSRPTVVGHQYSVSAALNVTAWGNREATETISFTNDAVTGFGIMTADAGATTWSDEFYPGDVITVGNSDEAGNNTAWIVTAVTDTTINVSTAMTVSANDTSVTLTAWYEYLPASDLGLNTISSLSITGYEDRGISLRVAVLNDGTRAGGNGSGYVLLYGKTDASAAIIVNDTDIGYVHVKAYGSI